MRIKCGVQLARMFQHGLDPGFEMKARFMDEGDRQFGGGVNRVLGSVEDMVEVGLVETGKFACPVGCERGGEIEVKAHVC